MHNSSRANFSVALLGSGGAGIVTIGQLLLTLAARRGLYGVMSKSYGPQIRGGESAALLRLADRPVFSAPDSFDLVMAVDWRNAERFADEMPLRADSLIVFDEAGGDPPDFTQVAGQHEVLPLTALAKTVKRGRSNMVALGWLARWLGCAFGELEALLGEHFASKGEDVVGASVETARAGFEHFGDERKPIAIPLPAPAQRWMLSGNEAAGYGALKGGIRFVAAYPITPASDLLEYMAPRLQKVGGALLQAEDELASINAVIGASWGGIPSLTATSGPGLALMTEALGLAVMSETPLVVSDVQRGGPSTGIPTKSEQTDLNIALHGLHGDAPHLVLAPLGIADAMVTTQWAVHLAETLQAPALVLSDQFLGQTTAVIDRPADVDFATRRLRAELKPGDDYQRYATTADGFSPMAVPGDAGGMHTADGLEHQPTGTPSSAAADHHAQLDKRLRKLEAFDYGELACHTEGSGAIAIVCWGSALGACHEARERLAADGIDVRVVAPRLLAPLPVDALREALDGADRVLVVEQSHRGQFLRYLRSELNGLDARLMARPGPLPIRPGDVIEELRLMEQNP